MLKPCNSLFLNCGTWHLLVQTLLLELESQPLADPDAQAHIHPAGSQDLALEIAACLSIGIYISLIALSE